MFAKESGLLQGTLELLILKTLSWAPMHGYGIAQWIRQRTDGALAVEDAALYQALHRLERKGWVDAEWGVSENNRRAKFYRLTAEGERQFRAQASGWERFASAVSRAIATTQAPAWAR